MQKRRRFKQTQSLEDRLAQDTAQLREQAKALPPGRARELIMAKITQNEAASHLCEMLRAPSAQRSEGLR
jgi:AmiR/NasT family two-component response regulator